LKWLEVSLNVNGELAEAVAELFARYASEGVALEWLPGDEHHPHEEIKVTVYVPIEGDIHAAKSKVEEGLWHLGQISPLPEAEYRLIEDGDWKHAWRDHYRPIPVGESLLIIPAWMTVAESDRHPIILEPGMAFGTGTHPTTKLCLQAMETHLQRGDRVLDVGTGSGILSIAAARLGAERVWALDTDPDAIDVASDNLDRNDVSTCVQLHVGDLSEVVGSNNIRPVELLVANILAPVLTSLLEGGMSDALRPEGTIILSGILFDQVDPLLELAEKIGLILDEIDAEDEWRALVFRKSPLSNN
jgi:ribosomal protein L11 methyltransferase